MKKYIELNKKKILNKKYILHISSIIITNIMMYLIISLGLIFADSTIKPSIKIPIYTINNIDYIEVADYAIINNGSL